MTTKAITIFAILVLVIALSFATRPQHPEPLFGAGETYATWNSSDKGANFVLSGGNLIATKDNNAWQSVRATIGKSTGKWYWECTITNAQLNNSSPACGVGNSSAVVSNYFYVDANGWAVFTNDSDIGKSTNNTNTSFSAGGSSDGVVLMIAYDADAGKIWFGRNGSWLGSGDPANGTNAAYSGLSGTLYPMATAFYSGSAITANFGASALSYSAPSGFNSGWYTAAASTPTIDQTDIQVLES